MGASGSANATGTSAATQQCKDLGVTVSFETGSFTLDQNAKGALDGVSKWMHANEGRTLRLRGFADTTGNTTANITLSQERADNVRDYLTQQGVDPARISTVGHGEEHPEMRSLPSQGRAVTFEGCQPLKVAEAIGAPAAPEPPPGPSPEPVAPVEETPPAPVAVTPPPPEPQYELAPGYHYTSVIGMALLVGGGYEDFTSSNARSLTKGGGSWNARIVAGTRSFVGLEAAYVGTANNVNVLGLNASTSTVVGNGLEGALRLQVPIMAGYNMIEPFGFVGLGWMNYRLTNNRAALSDFSNRSDNVMTVPLGGGVAYTYKMFTVDARASWTPTYYNNLIINTASGNNRLDHWGIGGNLGVAF
jgi:hypothetical protein